MTLLSNMKHTGKLKGLKVLDRFPFVSSDILSNSNKMIEALVHIERAKPKSARSETK